MSESRLWGAGVEAYNKNTSQRDVKYQNEGDAPDAHGHDELEPQ